MVSHLLAVRKGEDVMSTMTGNMRRAILSGLAGAVIAVAGVGVARGDVVSDRAGAILIFPKIIVDTSSGLFGPPTDTEIQITNTSNSTVAARCFLVNATSHCSNAPSTACTTETQATRCPAGGVCIANWNESDFRMTLTKRQPIEWKVSDGLPTFPLDGVNKFGPGNQSNKGSDGSPSSIRPVPEDPFIGELKCVEVDPSDFTPTAGFDPANNGGGDLKGEATIVSATTDVGTTPTVDARKYNGIGLESTTVNDKNDTLIVGGPGAEYNGCPNVIIMNHLFDNSTVVTHGGNVSGTIFSDLTVVPCSEDFRLQENNLGGATLQFLVFNEFEQRFSTSTSFSCFREVRLSDIDTRPGPTGDSQSIFNVAVEGTLGGQTRIRAVAGPNRANGVLAIAESFWSSTTTAAPGARFSAAVNTHFTGSRDASDQIILSPDLP